MSDQILTNLNPEQREAVEHIDGPTLVLAGAGTGKTKVLTSRIANILNQNKAFPSQIVAVTFTNKAAKEMQERVEAMVPGYGGGLWLGTFHSVALRILRKHCECVGLTSNFTILDTDDQIRLIKRVLQELNIDEKRWPAKTFLSIIQSFKDRALNPEMAKDSDTSHFANGRLIQVYETYQTKLKNLNACDFGDLQLHNITIFKNHKDILEEYQRKFRYILVDEYQDTNIAQYLWLRLLAMHHHNICCVGDDDQSIYGWRGAEVGNILKFEKDFPGAKVIRLERNYRSTSDILAAASSLIANNKDRLGKTLWTELKDTKKVNVISVWDEKQEAKYVADEIEAIHQLRRMQLKNIAILVRTGSQTRAFEECFTAQSIAYKVVGGLRFYERMEIRDAIAYMRCTVQPSDDLAFERIVNTPKRGIGDATVDHIREVANSQGLPMLAATAKLLEARAFKPKVHETLAQLLGDFDRWQTRLTQQTHAEVVEAILEESGYISMWKNDKTIEAEGRLENLKELIVALGEFASLEEFLEHVSLVMDSDNIDDSDMVRIMTLHSAKGLEFDTVFLPGWEEGLFPHQKRIDEEGTAGIEEERRLAYVGITRAKRNLTILFAANRRIFNQWQSSICSRFVDELPAANIEIKNLGTGYAPGAKQSGLHYSNPPLNQPKKKPDFSNFNFSGFGEKPKAQQQVKTSDGFFKNQRVFHVKFGYGRIIQIDGSHLTISFEKAGTKNIMKDFVKRAETV